MQDPIFLVSLAKDEARRERLKQRFKGYEKFKLISAVDGRSMSAKEYFALVMPSLRLLGRLMSPAEVGCALSHVAAYEAFLATDAPRALIIEDDVIGDDSCVKFALEVAERLPQNAVLICGCQDGLPARFSAFGKRIADGREPSNGLKFSSNLAGGLNFSRNAHEIALPTPLNGKDRSVFLVSEHSIGSICSTAAYVISREAAQRLLDSHKAALKTSDLWDVLLPSNDLQMYFADIFAHPTDMAESNINAERDARGYAGLSLRGLLRSARYIALTRWQAKFGGFERIFKKGAQ